MAAETPEGTTLASETQPTTPEMQPSSVKSPASETQESPEPTQAPTTVTESSPTMSDRYEAFRVWFEAFKTHTIDSINYGFGKLAYFCYDYPCMVRTIQQVVILLFMCYSADYHGCDLDVFHSRYWSFAKGRHH